MATNSIRGLRRPSRLIVYTRRAKRVHKDIVYTRRAKRVHKEIPRRSFRLQNSSRKNRSTQSLRRSPRLKAASFSENSEQNCGGLVHISKISNVEDLLKTGFFDGVQVTCYSKDRQGNLLGIIKGGGFLCGCSQCDYKGEVLSAKMFEKHAGANTKTQADHIFFSNGFNLYKVSQIVRNIPEEDVSVKILKLRGDLKQEHLSEELRCDPTNIVTARRSKRKRRETGFQRSIALVENDTSKKSRKLLRSEDAVTNEELNVEEIFCVKDLLKTGLFEGASITYISEKKQVKLPGIIEGTGYVCGCPMCTYTGEVLSARKFKEHAQCKNSNPNNCVFFSNGISIFEVAMKLKGIHGNALKNKLDKIISEVEFVKQYTNDELEKDKSSEGSNHLQKSFEGSRQFLKCYRRYTPERHLMDVQGLLSTGLLEGFRVTYMRSEAKLAAYIRGAKYECGCSSCNYTKVITAREIERHASEFSDNPNENIYLENGMTLCQLVKELKGIPLYNLGSSLQEKIKCHPNYNSFDIWKGSFKMGDDSPNFRSDSERRPQDNSRHSSVQSISRDEVSVSEPTKNTDRTTNASHVGDDYIMKNLDHNSDQCLNQPIESTNSNFQHCPVSKPITVSNLAETFTDSVPKGIDDLAKGSFPNNIIENNSRVQASISEATRNNDRMVNSSHVRDNNSLKNLDFNSDQCLNQPNESTNSNSQQCSVFKSTIVTDPAETIKDSHSEGINDLAKVSVTMNTSEPFNVKLNTAPGSCGLDSPGASISEGTSAVSKGGINIGRDEWPLDRVTRKSRSQRIFKFIKRDDNFHAGPSSLTGNTVQKVKFEFSSVDSMTASDPTEAATADPDYNHLESGSEEGLTDEEKTSLIGVTVKRRDVHLHKRIFEVGGLPDGSALTYQHHNKVLLFGVKQGSVIKCACHNDEFTPSQFEAHAGMGQRRQPYRNIYNSDGKTLHELSLELPDVPRSSSGMSYSRPIIHVQRKKEHYFPTSRRLKYALQSHKGVSVQCTICKERRATLGDEADPKLVIFCNQCDRAYHIGCMEDQELLKIEDVFNGNWFCCTDCTWVHDSLKKICALGAKPVPTPFFDLLKKPHTTENNLANLSWQIFRGGNTKDQVLLSQSLQFLKSVFKPILLGRQEMLRQMVFGKQVEGTGLDFRGVHFIVIKLDGEIVSIAVLRVFGKYIAELPLATTSKVWRQQGYFRVLLNFIEELLRLLQVRLLVSPVPNKMQSIWTDKFGFVKASDQKVQMLKEQHGVMLFEDTAVLVKEIQAVDD
ncbi:uncharacterized protein LOC144555463 isoform X2 [Carex rostrata]